MATNIDGELVQNPEKIFYQKKNKNLLLLIMVEYVIRINPSTEDNWKSWKHTTNIYLKYSENKQSHEELEDQICGK